MILFQRDHYDFGCFEEIEVKTKKKKKFQAMHRTIEAYCMIAWAGSL
jgi:organic hydroperoxide reductase OsmC/OhrA